MTQQMQAKIPPDAETSISPQTQISDYQKQLFQTRVTTYLGKAENQRELVRGFEGAEISLKVWDMVAKGDIAPLVFTRFERDMKDMLGYIASGALELEFKQGAKQMTRTAVARFTRPTGGRSLISLLISAAKIMVPNSNPTEAAMFRRKAPSGLYPSQSLPPTAVAPSAAWHVLTT